MQSLNKTHQDLSLPFSIIYNGNENDISIGIHDVTRYTTAIFSSFFPYICITLVAKFDITQQSNEMQYYGHRGLCVASLSSAVVTGLCRIRSPLPRWLTVCFPRTIRVILFHKRFSKCWLAVSKNRAGGLSRHKMESCLKILEIFLSIFNFFQRMLILHINSIFQCPHRD